MRFPQVLVGFLVTGLLIGVWAWPGSEGLGASQRGEDLIKAKPTHDQLVFFETKVLPILQKSCFKCHGGEKKVKGRLRLTSKEGIIKGGEKASALYANNLAKSNLLEMMTWKDEDHEMPPKKKLSQDKIDVITKWVKMGAPFPPGKDYGVEPAKDAHAPVIDAESKNWWVYKKIESPRLPAVKNRAWVKNAIDAFVLAKLEAEGLTPNERAGKIALIRRAYFNVTGLPPTPKDVDAFVADQSPNAWEKLVDKLLASPQYGERWARHWLDLVRYAETNGYERDSKKPYAWRYRDYVIDAFNSDLPYDQFVTEQLAGDEIDEPTTQSYIATGYYRLGIWNDEPADRLLHKYDVLDGVVSTTGNAFMGMSVGCARCHSHKKDPIPHEDYYRMLAFFRNISDMSKNPTRKVIDTGQRKALAKLDKKQKQEAAQLYSKIFGLEQEFKLAAKTKLWGVKIDTRRASDLVELKYKFYRDTWEKLPDFDGIKHETEGRLADNYLSLEPASRKHAIGLVYEGQLRVPANGRYAFHVTSMNGSRILIDKKVLAERDGKGKKSYSKLVTLTKGLHDFRVEYFNAYDEPNLEVSWSGPGFKKRLLSDASGASLTKQAGSTIFVDARKGMETWAYTTAKPAGGWTVVGFDDKKWKRGAGGFGRTGTPNAHVKTPWHTKEIFLRKAFHLKGVPSQVDMTFHHDEDMTVYINGKQVHRATGFRTNYSKVRLSAKHFKTGLNVIAIHCKQTSGGQYVDVGLRAVGGHTDLPTLVERHGNKVIGARKTQEYLKLRAQLIALRKPAKPKTGGGLTVMSVSERGNAATHVLRRGNPHLQGKAVQPGFPAVLGFADPKIEKTKHGTLGRRLAFAKWLTDKGNPLTARVMVNRVWQHQFGRGIVTSSSEFGRLGQLPTHPKLLDWLAADFRDNGWKIKRLQKMIMMSNTYQMSSKDNTTALAKDPANRFFWRFDMRRMTAEEIRDAILAVNGTLNLKMAGPSIYTKVPKEILASASRPNSAWGRSSVEDQRRRSVYIFIKRSLVEPLLGSFDLADTDNSCAVRFATTVPTQSLTSLNSEFFQEQAGLFAKRLRTEHPGDLKAQISHALRLVYSRKPKAREIERGQKLISSLMKEDSVSKENALKYFCLVCLNLNEFFYLD